MEFGRKVRLLRVARGWTQGELADILRANRAHIWQIESGSMLPGERMERELRLALAWPANADEAFAILEGVGERALTGPLQTGEGAA